MPRLEGLLARADGEARFELQFGRDDIGTAYVDVHVEAEPWLLCQRTLEPFRYQLNRDVRLGLITDESEEAALPPGCEPLLVGEDPVRVTDVVEDELILSLPLVATCDGEPLDASFGEVGSEPEEEKENPFSVLAALKGGDESKQ